MRFTRFITLFTLVLSALLLHGQDTITVQTLTYDSTGRDYVFDFPEDDGTTYSRIIMEYSMRCKGARVSTGSDRNLGCGEWDYSCNTYITDSTKVDSLQATHPSFIISGWQGETYNYSLSPTNTYYQRPFSFGTVTDDSEVLRHNMSLDDVAVQPSQTRKHYYLYTSEDLSNAGVEAGVIHGVNMPFADASEMDNLRIRLGYSSASNLVQPPADADLTMVYWNNISDTELSADRWFCEEFTWDGTQNVIMEVSYETTGSNTMSWPTSTSLESAALVSGDRPNYYHLDGSTYINVPDGALSAISDEITIEFWSRGNEDVLPRNTSILEGLNSRGQRSINVHLPWSNGQVYWDSGVGPGYDRINQPADVDVYEGEWHHWAFTKNVSTGVMQIYLDGDLWLSGTGKSQPMQISTLKIGSSGNGSNIYPGDIDEFRVWSSALNGETIREYMHRSIDVLHPANGALVLDYDMNGVDGSITDNVTGVEATVTGTDGLTAHWSGDISNGMMASNAVMSVEWLQGPVEVSCTESIHVDTVTNTPNTVNAYKVVGTDIALDSTYMVWEAVAEQVIDPDGNVVETLDVAVDGSTTIEDLEYFRKLPSRFEIMSFVTPYGIGLDLGPNGRTWTFDMTDYTPLLKGSKRMFLGNGGQNQEEMDIKFHFIKGTPSRDVIDIQQIWRPGSHCNYTGIRNDDCFEPRIITPNPEASYYKVRSMITGHGQEGEFIGRNHSISINGLDEFNWRVWKECADNPVYPQGGTWIYDRAGWCPGMATDLYEWDLEDIVFPGEPFEIDYGMNAATGDSRYLINHQLVTYGDYNMDYDVAVVDIVNPSSDVRFARTNPTCYAPMVRIQNLGGETINNLSIRYSAGGQVLTHEWDGRIRPQEIEDIELPIDFSEFYAGVSPGSAEFFVEVVSVEEGDHVDQQSHNDRLTTTFEMPTMFDDEDFIVTLRTNNAASENRLQVRNESDELILNKLLLVNNRTYRDTLELEKGCYTMQITDSGDNGLDFWAIPGQGTGALRLSSFSRTLQIIEPDFGAESTYAWMVGSTTNVVDVTPAVATTIYPNPTTGAVTVTFDSPLDTNCELIITNALGQQVYVGALQEGQRSTQADFSEAVPGVYRLMIISDSDVVAAQQIIKM